MSVGLTALAVVVAFAAPATAESDLVRNGSFEAPHIAHRGFRSYAAGQHIGPWHVTSGAAFVISEPLNVVAANPHGLQVLNLRPADDPGSAQICQALDGLTPGAAYKLRFLATSIFGAGTIDVTFAGSVVANLVLPDSGSIPATLRRHAWVVTPDAATETLCLTGDAGGAEGFPLVDGVRLLPLAG